MTPRTAIIMSTSCQESKYCYYSLLQFEALLLKHKGAYAGKRECVALWLRCVLLYMRLVSFTSLSVSKGFWSDHKKNDISQFLNSPPLSFYSSSLKRKKNKETKKKIFSFFLYFSLFSSPVFTNIYFMRSLWDLISTYKKRLITKFLLSHLIFFVVLVQNDPGMSTCNFGAWVTLGFNRIESLFAITVIQSSKFLVICSFLLPPFPV